MAANQEAEGHVIVSMRVADIDSDHIPDGAVQRPCASCAHPVIVSPTSKVFLAAHKGTPVQCTRCVAARPVIDLIDAGPVPGAIEEMRAHITKRMRSRQGTPPATGRSN